MHCLYLALLRWQFASQPRHISPSLILRRFQLYELSPWDTTETGIADAVNRYCQQNSPYLSSCITKTNRNYRSVVDKHFS
jgi:hypothetical protein